MSNLLRIHHRIAELFGIFSYQAKTNSAAGKTDFNKVSEDVLVPLFKHIFKLYNIHNLNSVERNNFPAIDLADDIAEVAVQVTATADSSKIKSTLTTFIEKELFKKYPNLKFYILTEKKSSYPKNAIEEIINNKFEFDIENDIYDYRDLIKACSSFQIDEASTIMRLLEANFGRGDYSVFNEKQKEPFEDVHLNLIELSFPKKLFVADLLINNAEIIENSRGTLRKKDSQRAIIRSYALEQLKLDFFSGWHLYKNQLITFRDLHEEKDSFLSKIIDKGTITPIDFESFYSEQGQIDIAKENVFKSLLRRTLQEQLYNQAVEWQYDEGLFIFVENGSEKKRSKFVNRKTDDGLKREKLTIFNRYESWKGRKENKRTVLEIFMKSETPDDVWYFKHRAFEAKFKRIGTEWFLLVLPDWFFSYDGNTKSDFHADDLKWLKKNANTENVFNDFRFIHYFLKFSGDDLFREKSFKRLFKYGDHISFGNAPFLYDEAWNPPEKKKKKKKEIADEVGSDSKPEQDSLF